METIWSAPFNEQMIWGSSPLRLSTILAGFTSSSVVFTSCADTSSMVGEVRPVSDLQYISEDSDNALLFCLKSTTGHWFDMAGLWMVILPTVYLDLGSNWMTLVNQFLLILQKIRGVGGLQDFVKSSALSTASTHMECFVFLCKERKMLLLALFRHNPTPTRDLIDVNSPRWRMKDHLDPIVFRQFKNLQLSRYFDLFKTC